MADIIATPTYFIDIHGEEHQIFPMVLNEMAEASRLFSKLNSDMYAGLNLPSPEYYTNGKHKGQMKIDRKTKEPVLDFTAYHAMLKLIAMATHEEEPEFSAWVDMSNAMEIIDLYRNVSEVKKKIAQETEKETSIALSQLLLKTLPKQENPLVDLPSDN